MPNTRNWKPPQLSSKLKAPRSFPLTNPASEHLTFTPGDDRWKQLRERGLHDLFWFSSIVLGYPNVFPMRAETHLLFCRFLERRTGIADIDSAPIQKCETPRGTGKTSRGTG